MGKSLKKIKRVHAKEFEELEMFYQNRHLELRGGAGQQLR